MKIIIDIPDIDDNEDYFLLGQVRMPNNSDEFGRIVVNAIKHGTPLPPNTTNGDMIKAMFPYADIVVGQRKGETFNMVYLRHNNMTDASFYEDWWNAPYNKEN